MVSERSLRLDVWKLRIDVSPYKSCHCTLASSVSQPATSNSEEMVVEGDNSEYIYDEDDACDSDEVDAILEDFCGKSVSSDEDYEFIEATRVVMSPMMIIAWRKMIGAADFAPTFSSFCCLLFFSVSTRIYLSRYYSCSRFFV